MIMHSISKLKLEDLNLAYNIEQASQAFPWTEDIFNSNQGKNYFNLKLSDNFQIVGFAISQLILDEATLLNIAIHPKYRRCNFGRHLLQTLIQQLRLRGVVTLWLEVRVSNVAAIALYDNIGFNQVTLRRNYYHRNNTSEDAIVMALSLS